MEGAAAEGLQQRLQSTNAEKPADRKIVAPRVAVGTALAGGPPHRSRRAELPHRAPALGLNAQALVGIGMQDTRQGQPAIRQGIRPLP